jgi:long-subunit acyl-CoA synthetase (AMP-forming)
MRMLKQLQEYGQNGLKTPIIGKDIANLLGDLLRDPQTAFCGLLSESMSPVLCDPTDLRRKPLTHRALKQYIENFDLRQYGLPHNSRVAVMLPNGPILATASVAILSRWCAVPINPLSTFQEMVNDLHSTKAVAIVLLDDEMVDNSAALQAAESLDMCVLMLSPVGKEF